MNENLKIPCSCGGTLSGGFVDTFDATVPLGYPVMVEGKVPGLICDQCGAFAPTGELLELTITLAAAHLLTSTRRLSGKELRFLRRNLFGSTQEDLADRLAISRRTLIRWEESSSLSPDADFMVRGVCTPPLLERIGPESRLREIVRGALGATRSKEAPKRLQRMRLKSAELLESNAA